MKNLVLNFLLMIQFLTRIPVKLNLPCEKEDFRRGAAFLPLVGFVVGLTQWGAYELLIKVLPLNTTIVIIILIGIIVTGAIHLDGLGDTCDGFFAFKGSDKIIEIMKDSRIGSYACIAVIFDLLFKYTLFSFIAPKLSVGIIAVPTISRFSLLLLITIGKNAKKTGTGNLFVENVGKTQLFIGLIIALGILILIMNSRYVAILLSAGVIFTAIFNQFSKSKIGGITGDILGANNELVEILTLILIAIILR